mmetsp:Transcript_25247/g.79649  ORF Transcript_25247/g.79649 Transcript_25247/m.79649 type:complete len:309 (+) Transcript_25247:92-1018(+)
MVLPSSVDDPQSGPSGGDAEGAAAAAIAGALWVSENAQHKCEALLAGGVGQLQLLVDFDHTLTSPPSPMCHDILGHSPLMPAAYGAAMGRMLDFTPGGYARSMNEEQWWAECNRLLAELGEPTPEAFHSVVAAAKVPLRAGAAELLCAADAAGVPCLVVSAGFTNVIREVLAQNGVQAAHLDVLANEVLFPDDASGRQSVELAPDPPVTSRCKSRTAELRPEHFERAAGRSHALVLGDKPRDTAVSEGVRGLSQVLRVGIHNGASTEELPPFCDYQAAFDVILDGAAGLQPLAAFVRAVAAGAARPGA